MKRTVKIPTSLSEITTAQLIQYLIGKPTDTEGAILRALKIFSGIDPEELRILSLEDHQEVLEAVAGMLNEVPESPATFEFEGITYGRIPDFNEMTIGEFVDLSNYLRDERHLAKAMAVAYRPVTKKMKRLYTIEEYEGSKKYEAVMERVPADISTGLAVFFYALAKALAVTGLLSSQEKAQMRKALHSLPEQPLVSGGAGTLISSNSQEGTLLRCVRLLSSPLESSSLP